MTESHWSMSFQFARPLFIWQTLFDPPPDFRHGVVEGVEPGDSEIVVAVDNDEFGLIGLDGRVQLLGSHLGPALRASLLDTSLVWASAAEPSSQQGKKSHPSSLAVTHDGSAVAEEAKPVDGDLLGRGDRGFAGLMAAPLASWRGRTGFVPVYSRTLGAIYLAGGKDSVGARWPTVARGTLGLDRTWAQLVPPVRLRDVLGATYSYRTRSLYVLDRRHEACDGVTDEDACEDAYTSSAGATVRFIRVDAVRGGGEVIASWAADDLPETVWLGSDLDGKVLVSFSSRASNTHGLLRYDVDLQTVEPLEAGPNPLMVPVLVDANGFVVYTIGPRGEVAGVRYPTLSGTLHPIADLDTLL